MSSFNSIAADKLWRLIGVPHGPVLIDVRGKDDFAANPRYIPGAIRRPRETVSSWAREFAGQSVVAICETGRGESEGVAAWLRDGGASSAEVLAGGHAGWSQAGLPLVPEGKLPPRDFARADDMGDTLSPENRPHRLSLAHPPLCRSHSGFPFCRAGGSACGRGALQRRSFRRRGRNLEPSRRALHVRYNP